MELGNIKQVYLVGIGGIGMSALARYFHKRGCFVSGYDRTETELTDQLITEGISIVFDDREMNILPAFQQNSSGTLIIYTPAIPKDSAILNYFKNNGFSIKKRSEVLGIISSGMFTVAVAGTHGKTTTSSMIAHIFKSSGVDCSAFLGGITVNYDTNFLYGNSNIVVAEADEYDRSFLTLHPDIAVITSMDADHLDIYGDKSHVEESFRLFASQLKSGGKLIFKKDLDLTNGMTYSTTASADIMGENIRIENGDFYFDFKNKELNIKNIRLGTPGRHNVENAVAATEVALSVGIDPEKVKTALGEFKGVKRRFEYIVKNDTKIFIDDYAHHPEELLACIGAVKSLYPGRKLTAIFQPHLYTRTRDFADGFAGALDMTDELLMLDIYPARELPIPGVTSDMILNKMSIATRKKLSKQEVIDYVSREKPDLLLTVGAGDIDMLVEPLKNALIHA